MKQKVIKFFQNLPVEKHVQFNEAFKLYRDSQNKNVNVERSLNASGYSERTLENLLYDLQKIHEITDVEKSVQLAVVSDQVAEAITEALKSENEDLKLENEDLQSEKEELEEELETFKLAPKLDAKQIRVEFPFLKEKDCPDEFKILVADKITAWNRYLECQEEMVRIESGIVQETDLRKADLAHNAIEAFDENKKIYDELNCYQTTGKILGVHPIFKKVQLTREIETMTNDELIKYKASSAKYFSVNKTALAKAKKAKDDDKVLEIETRVAERHDKLFLVNKKLGV